MITPIHVLSPISLSKQSTSRPIFISRLTFKIFHIPQPASGLSFIPHPAKPTLDPSVKSITSNQFTERNSVVIERRLGITRPCMPVIQLCLWGLAKKRTNESLEHSIEHNSAESLSTRSHQFSIFESVPMFKIIKNY